MRWYLNRVKNLVRWRNGGLPFPQAAPGSDAEHLAAVIGWLVRAQKACGGRGVSILFDPSTGWHPDPYPETSGYILVTFLKYAELSGQTEFAQHAQAIGNWEIDIQRADGAVLSSVGRDLVRVFNTGQVILGWCRLFEKTQDQRFLDAAARAGRFLIATQEPDGAWVRHTVCGARTYHTRVAWALLRVAQLTGQMEFLAAAQANLRWAVAQQEPNGWFKHCGFHADPPITHVIGYTLRGLIESHDLAARQRWDLGVPALAAATHLGAALLSCIGQANVERIPGLLPASFDRQWRPAAKFACLTGNVQIAIDLLRLAHITGEPHYDSAAGSLIDAVKRLHSCDHPDAGIRGAVAGAFPFYGPYVRGKFPNWAAKFLADALMMRMQRTTNCWVEG